MKNPIAFFGIVSVALLLAILAIQIFWPMKVEMGGTTYNVGRTGYKTAEPTNVQSSTTTA